MQTSEAQRSFTMLTQKVVRNRTHFSALCETLYEYFEKPPTESFLVDTTGQALPAAYLQGLADILSLPKSTVLGLYGNNNSFRKLWPVIERWSIQLSDIIHAQDSHYLDDSTVWVVMEAFYELIYKLFHKDTSVPRVICREPHPLSASQLYFKVVQSHRPNLHQAGIPTIQ